MSNRHMSISAFARRSLLSPKALRLYDESGLLRPERVDPHTGYRYYDESQLVKARSISLLRRLDIPLATIARILDAAPDDAQRQLDEWWNRTEDEFERRRELLRYIRSDVLGDNAMHAGLAESYNVHLCEVPETTYLYVSRHVTGPELPAFIGNSHDALLERASDYGGAIGAPTVIFRGIVDMDSNGPVDVCLPISPPRTDGDGIRTEAAHTQARVRLVKRQVEFPQILQVYQAIRSWIDTEGHEVSGAPREVYLGPFDMAGASDPICDIAFPIRLGKAKLHD